MTISTSTRRRLFTAGHITKGVIYLLIGVFALATLIGASSGGNGPKAVIDWVGTNPFGQVLLGLVGLGLAAYATWRFYLFTEDPDNEDDGKKGKVKRLGWAVSAVSYGALSVYAFQNLFGSGGSKGTKEDLIARLLDQSWGDIVVAAIGLIVVGVGVYQLYRAVTDKHMEDINHQRLGEEQEEVVRNSGRIGLAARFVVYGIMGGFLVRTALSSDADQFKGIGESLSYLENGTWGTALLAVTGAGLLAYGFFMMVKARYGVEG